MTQIRTLEDLIPLSPFVELAIRIMRARMECDIGHDEAHVIRVANKALRFGGRWANRNILLPAVILHDLVNVPKDSPQRSEASKLSADLAVASMREVLTEPGVETDSAILEVLDGIHHAIHAHSFSANVEPKTVEAAALQDADRIEALGPIGIARLFAVSGALKRPLFHPTDPLAEDRELDELAWSLDHFAVKLAKLHKTMRTEAGHEEASSLTLDMVAFIADLIIQIEGRDDTVENRLDTIERVERFAGIS